MRGIIKAAAWIGHAKGDQHPYRHSFQPDVGVADTAQALIKIAHPSDSRYQARPALMMVSSMRRQSAQVREISPGESPGFGCFGIVHW